MGEYRGIEGLKESAATAASRGNNKRTEKAFCKKQGFFLLVIIVVIILGLWASEPFASQNGGLASILAALGICVTICVAAISRFHGRLFPESAPMGAVYVFLIFAFTFCFSFVMRAVFSRTDEAETTVSSGDSGREAESLDVVSDSYQPMLFSFEADELFENLVFYIDGKEIPEERRESVLAGFIRTKLAEGGALEQYETDTDRLNTGGYAAATYEANQYSESYNAIKEFDIDASFKLLFLSTAIDRRKKANGTYVTPENNWNIIWDCLAMQNEISKLENWKDDFFQEMQEYNRDIMDAAWRILQIQYAKNGTVDPDVKTIMINAYKWERDNVSREDIDYDILIDAFEACESY